MTVVAVKVRIVGRNRFIAPLGQPEGLRPLARLMAKESGGALQGVAQLS
jgi:hypothetical protein